MLVVWLVELGISELEETVNETKTVEAEVEGEIVLVGRVLEEAVELENDSEPVSKTVEVDGSMLVEEDVRMLDRLSVVWMLVEELRLDDETSLLELDISVVDEGREEMELPEAEVTVGLEELVEEDSCVVLVLLQEIVDVTGPPRQ